VPGYGASASYLRTRGIRPGEPAPRAHPRFETEPGRQLQFDWKEDVVMHDRAGAEYRSDAYAPTLGHSRRHFLRRSMTGTRDDLLLSMTASICFLGGVPEQRVTDNMSAVASVGPDGRRVRDRRVLAFAREAGFELVLCRPRSPQTKGKDESANRFLTRLLAYDGDFDGWEGVDAAIATIQRRCNEEPNGTTGVPPDLLFLREKEALRPAPRRSLLESIAGQVSRQVVPPTMLAGAAGRQWSVPRRCIGRRAGLLLLPGGGPGACDGDELVAEHDTTAAGGPIACDEARYAEAMADKLWGGADADIEAAARRNLELLGSLGGGDEP
jgi:hypothetical protein